MLDYKVGKSTYIDVYLIGIVNTFIVALLGILAATVIGFTVGIMRLSDNLVFNGLLPFTLKSFVTSRCSSNYFFGILLCCAHCQVNVINLS